MPMCPGYRSVMAELPDITVEILQQIRDGIYQTNLRIDHLGDELSRRIDVTNERLERVEQRLGNVEGRLERVENGLTDLGNFMRPLARDFAQYERFHARRAP
jgi:chromosome segregation ATPase